MSISSSMARLLLLLLTTCMMAAAKVCNWIEDTDFSGGDYHPTGQGLNMTRKECCAFCAKDPQCDFAVLAGPKMPVPGSCWLKSLGATPFHRPGDVTCCPSGMECEPRPPSVIEEDKDTVPTSSVATYSIQLTFHRLTGANGTRRPLPASTPRVETTRCRRITSRIALTSARSSTTPRGSTAVRPRGTHPNACATSSGGRPIRSISLATRLSCLGDDRFCNIRTLFSD